MEVKQITWSSPNYEKVKKAMLNPARQKLQLKFNDIAYYRLYVEIISQLWTVEELKEYSTLWPNDLKTNLICHIDSLEKYEFFACYIDPNGYDVQFILHKCDTVPYLKTTKKVEGHIVKLTYPADKSFLECKTILQPHIMFPECISIHQIFKMFYWAANDGNEQLKLLILDRFYDKFRDHHGDLYYDIDYISVNFARSLPGDFKVSGKTAHRYLRFENYEALKIFSKIMKNFTPIAHNEKEAKEYQQWAEEKKKYFYNKSSNIVDALKYDRGLVTSYNGKGAKCCTVKIKTLEDVDNYVKLALHNNRIKGNSQRLKYYHRNILWIREVEIFYYVIERFESMLTDELCAKDKFYYSNYLKSKQKYETTKTNKAKVKFYRDMLRLFERIFHFEIRINSIEADEEFYRIFRSIENEAIFTAPCRKYLDFAIKYGFIDDSNFIKYERTQMRYVYRKTKCEEFKKYARDETLINENFAREMAEDLPLEPFKNQYCMKEWENKNCVLAAVTNRIEQKADEKIQEIIDKPKKKNK